MSDNEFGQPVGAVVTSWSPRPRPGSVPLPGSDVRVVPWSEPAHLAGLFTAVCADGDESRWTYLPHDLPRTSSELAAYVGLFSSRADAQVMTILDAADETVLGTASYLAIAESAGSVEVGAITFAPALARTRGATEAMWLMARHAFDLGYRRYEWKCDSLNVPSVRAALRLGFVPEGTFRHALVHKGRNRDTAWFSITDTEWPAVSRRLERWLDPANFDASGRQLSALADLSDG